MVCDVQYIVLANTGPGYCDAHNKFNVFYIYIVQCIACISVQHNIGQFLEGITIAKTSCPMLKP